MPYHRILFTAVLAAILSACSYVPHIVTEYRIDVQQGNVITQEMMTQLKPGQTREQVRFILGTPLLMDVFHSTPTAERPNIRWDYVYRLQNGRTGEVEMRRLTVFFDREGRLERVTGNVEPATVAELNAPVGRTQVVDLGTIPADGAPMPPPQEKSIFRSLLEKVGL